MVGWAWPTQQGVGIGRRSHAARPQTHSASWQEKHVLIELIALQQVIGCHLALQEMADAELAASGGNKAKGKGKDGKGQKKPPAKSLPKAPQKQQGKAQAKQSAPEKMRKDMTVCMPLSNCYCASRNPCLSVVAPACLCHHHLKTAQHLGDMPMSRVPCESCKSNKDCKGPVSSG